MVQCQGTLLLAEGPLEELLETLPLVALVALVAAEVELPALVEVPSIPAKLPTWIFTSMVKSLNVKSKCGVASHCASFYEMLMLNAAWLRVWCQWGCWQRLVPPGSTSRHRCCHSLRSGGPQSNNVCGGSVAFTSVAFKVWLSKCGFKKGWGL